MEPTDQRTGGTKPDDVDVQLDVDGKPQQDKARRFQRPDPDAATAAAEIGRRISRGLGELERRREERADAATPEAESGPPIREGSQRPAVMDRDALHRRLLAVADVASGAIAFVAAIVVSGGAPTAVVIAELPLIVLISKLIGLYDRDEHVLHKGTLEEAPALLNVALVTVLLAWLTESALSSTSYISKAALLLLGAVLVVLMGTARTIARRVALHMTPPERVLVLGTGDEADQLRAKLSTVSPVKAEVVGRVPVHHGRRADRGEDVLGIIPELDYVLRRHRIDRVVICPHGGRAGEMLDTIRLVKALGAKVSVMPRLFEVVGSSVEIDELGGLTLLGLRRSNLTKSSILLKRGFDVCAGALGLMLLAPFFAVIALAIKLTSSGPVFFCQPRVGRGGRPFQMLKFRTMYDGADGHKRRLLDRNEGADGFFKIADDPRCTPIGHWLRRVSLDELPQLINVLRGEMSLVGPRPLVDEEDARIEGWFRRRLDVTPGMTGAWQVLGSSRIPMTDMVTIDYLYRTNWTLWLDLKILLRTVPHVLRRRGL